MRRCCWAYLGLVCGVAIALPNISSAKEVRTQIDADAIAVQTQSEPWRQIQEDIGNTVVQIFAQIAEFNWFQPYATPEQYGTRGSGFLINEQGAIITNYHVIDQAVAVWVQMPALGKRPIRAHVTGFCPDMDIALLQIDADDLARIRQTLGSIAYLPLGNSDTIRRTDVVLALGYPLGQESLKSTTGVISGREQHLIQTDAPINPGNSGGPLLNAQGQVIGINTSGITEAQNVGYAIPVNHVRIILPTFEHTQILRKPYWGLISMKSTDAMADYFGNPQPGGCFLPEAVKEGLLHKAGLQTEDMIYEVDGHRMDIYGQLLLPWSEDKISITDYLSQLPLGGTVQLVVYRKGERLEFTLALKPTKMPPVHMVYPWYEQVDYEVFAGMVVMPLTLNHVRFLEDKVPGLASYAHTMGNKGPTLLITHIFANSELGQSRTMMPGCTIKEVNGIAVNTLEEFRAALTKSLETGFFVLKVVDQISCATDNMMVVLPIDNLINELPQLSELYRFPVSDAVKQLCASHNKSKKRIRKKGKAKR